MMNKKQLQAAAAALGNQLSAGISVLDACKRMGRFQPSYAEFWDRATVGISSGRPLSEYLAEEWPETLVNAIKAGEASGSLPKVFERIEETIELEREMQKLVAELAYPVGFGMLGLFVFVFFMVQVIPALSTTLGVGQHGFVFELSSWMRRTLELHWVSIFLVIGGLVGSGIYWISKPENRTSLIDWSLKIPVAGEALKYLYFGLWGHYMALIDSSGIPVIEGLQMTSSTLPRSLQIGMLKMAEEAVSRGLVEASDPEKQEPGDTRRDWPFYVSNAFLISHETGRLDKELIRAAGSMLKDGKARLKVVLWFANVGALFVSAILIVGPLMAYYIQLGIALADALKG